MTNLPAPLLEPETDVSIFGRAEVSRDILSGPGFVQLSDAAFRAQVHLMMAAWWQRPAGSVPMLDASLAQMAGFGRDVAAWCAVKDECIGAGWVLCADHRYYFAPMVEAVEIAFDHRTSRDKGATIRQRRKRMRIALIEMGAVEAALTVEALDGAWRALEDRGAKALRGSARADALRMVAVDLRILPREMTAPTIADRRLDFDFKTGGGGTARRRA